MTPTDNIPTLHTIDQRLQHVETQVADIHRALVGNVDGSVRGLQARVERLEVWGRWLAAIATAALLGAIGHGIRILAQ